MADIVKQILARPIQMADQVSKTADDAYSFRQECLELKGKTEKLAALLRQAARAGNDLYERPTRRIIDETEQVLTKALALVDKCRATGLLKRVFTIIPAAAFRKTSMQLENSIGDVSWLLQVSASGDNRDDEYLGLPPIAANEPILCLIWEQVAILYTGSLEARADAAASLVSLARDNDRYGRLIIEEGGVPPLLKLAKEGKIEGQEQAARAIGLLGRDPESVEQIVHAGVCQVFSKILKEGHMQVQAEVALAVSELAEHHPKCQDHFAQNNIIRFLVSHVAFETIQEHSKYTIVTNKQSMSSIHSVMLESNSKTTNQDGVSELKESDNDETKSKISHPMGNLQNQNQMHSIVTNTMAMKNDQDKPQPKQNNQQQGKGTPTPKQNHGKGGTNSLNYGRGNNSHHPHVSLSGASIKGREYEEPATKARMKEMATKALWKLAKGNLQISSSITESRALLCFAVLLEKGNDEVKFSSAMALMEIAAVAEQHFELRRSAFKPTSPAAKAVVEQLLKVIENETPGLLLPCIKAIGSLSRTFRATETRIIGPLVKLLEEREPEISMEAAVALNKFACTDNFLHDNHSKAIINAGGAKHLIQLVFFGEQMVQIPSLILLCYISLNVPDSETLAQDEILSILEWSTKQAHLAEEPTIQQILPEAKSRLELYQSRGRRGFY